MTIRWNQDGMVAAVVQDADTRQVLMLGWMNAEALERTRASGRVTFWSRSRDELWEKGATSGNWLELVAIDEDCDGDALLVRANPHGPTCHTGTATCWGDQKVAGFAALDRLWEVIEDRRASATPDSYTVRLLSDGPDLPGRKLVEEATEVLMATKDHAQGRADDRRVAEEAADLVYHLLVALAERGVDPGDVLGVLAERRS